MRELILSLHNTHPSQWNDVIIQDKERLLKKESDLFNKFKKSTMKKYTFELEIPKHLNKFDQPGIFITTTACEFAPVESEDDFKTWINIHFSVNVSHCILITDWWELHNLAIKYAGQYFLSLNKQAA